MVRKEDGIPGVVLHIVGTVVRSIAVHLGTTTAASDSLSSPQCQYWECESRPASLHTHTGLHVCKGCYPRSGGLRIGVS